MTSPDPPSSAPQSPQSNGGSPSRHGLTLAITNLTKLVGLALAINEAALRAEPRNSVIILCAICVLGVQVVENVLLRMVDRLFGASGSSP
jgi:hypothetical protein